ncbi:MAG: hypothetical protein K2P44_06625 [Lachnospiraceae bacterium]|nr:hypothetical protein [Lachnospiraceae bacterium]
MSSCYAAGVKRALLYAALRARFWQGQGFILNLGKIAFYDENGKYVRSKKEIPVEDGNVCIGCKTIVRGEVYKRNIFTARTSFLTSPYQLKIAKLGYISILDY